LETVAFERNVGEELNFTLPRGIVEEEEFWIIQGRGEERGIFGVESNEMGGSLEDWVFLEEFQ